MNNDLIYLDYAAATPVDAAVLKAMQPYFSDLFFNPSSPYAPSVMVKRQYQDAKARIARQLGVGTDELVMTAGATESVNLAFTAGVGPCLVAEIEHASVLAAGKRRGLVATIHPNKKGRISPEAVKEALTPEVGLVSIALANHELGVIQPIEEISRVLEAERERRRQNDEDTPLYFHTDASQAGALIDLKIKRLGVDLLTLSAAKIYGPKQVGLLWVRPGVKLSANIVGGGQEAGLRSGTENVAGVIGFAAALELAAKRRQAEVKRLKTLRDQMAKKLAQEFPEMIISTDLKKSLSNFLNISFPGLDAERLIFMLENKGILLATGSACAANSDTRSAVLAAIGLKDDEIDGSLRITLGRGSNESNCQAAINGIIEVMKSEYQRTRND